MSNYVLEIREEPNPGVDYNFLGTLILNGMGVVQVFGGDTVEDIESVVEEHFSTVFDTFIFPPIPVYH